MVSKKVVDYIKEGLDKGFSPAHIKDVLVKHGHHPGDIDYSIKVAVSSNRPEPSSGIGSIQGPQPIEPSLPVPVTGRTFRLHPLSYIIPLAIIVFVAVILLNTNAGNRISGAVIGVNDDINEDEISELIDRISTMSLSIEEKEQMISEQMEILNTLDLTVEEKEALIEEQIHEINELYDNIRQERMDIKSLLMELTNSILERNARKARG